MAKPEDQSEQGPSPEPAQGAWRDLLAAHRTLANVLAHVVLFTVALLAAFLIRFDAAAGLQERQGWITQRFLPTLPYFILLKLILFGRLKLFRGGWDYSSIRDVANILLASWLFVVITFPLVYVLYRIPQGMGFEVPLLGDYFARIARGVLLLDFLATVFLVCTARLGVRIYREELRPISPEGVTRVLIVGAGDAAESIVREINRMPVDRYRVVGFVDDDPNKQGLHIHGLPVLGTTADIPQLCREESVEEIIIAIPSASQKELRRVIDLCSGTKLKFQSLPSVTDLIDGRVTASQIRPVDINDLLGRETVELDEDAIGRFLRGRRVLITGAGGSIGSEMARQVCRFGPSQLVLVEQAETPLFDIENELKRSFGHVDLVPAICDIYDRNRVLTLWNDRDPDVVIHAAAHKHVPLMEQNPCEAIKNNILGTKNVADASCRTRVAEFVMISTDKAVNPSSVMGASKRVAEIYVQSLNGRQDCRTRFKAVRFGNVLGSTGSVVPTFRKQIARGGPVTVTHPEMVRYFMTIPEAAQLVLQASATGEGGQVLLLDMGEPVRIVDLARNMITLSGFVPGEDIDIRFTGVRPGEKLFEELRTEGEDIEPTVHPKVLVWRHAPAAWEDVESAIERLGALANCPNRLDVVRALQEIVPEYQPSARNDNSEGPADAHPTGPAETTGSEAVS